jgi:uncharacterized protein (DUF58 family)
MLTDPAFIRRLDSLYLLARKVLGGSLQADRKSMRKGTGVTFADYAEYYYGADYRAIDWRIYARFESLVIKLFELEEDATVYLLVDSSHSMDSKFLYARKLAAALGYITLKSLDRLVVYSLADELRTILDSCRGSAKILTFLRSLEDATTFGVDTRFNSCARVFQARHRRRGLVIVFSDFFYPNGFEEGLQFLQFHGHDVYCLQVQDENDTRCTWKGDVDLECVETSRRKRVTISPHEARQYEETVAEWNEGLRRFCARNGIGLAYTTTTPPFESVVQGILCRGGLVA